ncbi:hypothetical protein Tco_0781745 [Tanacetum coccineum]
MRFRHNAWEVDQLPPSTPCIVEVLDSIDEFKDRLQVTIGRRWLSLVEGFNTKPKEVLINKSFMGKKAGPSEEQAKHFKWALCDWILDGIVNMRFTDVAQVANAARNLEILRERGYDQKGYDDRSYDRQSGNSNQKSWQNRGHWYNLCCLVFRYNKDTPDYASSPPCDICGKLHPGKACHRVTRACFTCGSTVIIRLGIWPGIALRMVETCKGNGNDNQPAAKGRVLSSTKDQAANSSGATHSMVSVSDAKHISISTGHGESKGSGLLRFVSGSLKTQSSLF